MHGFYMLVLFLVGRCSCGGPALVGTITVDSDVYDVYQGVQKGVYFNSPNKNGASTVKYITNNKKYKDAIVYA
jgi:hypothetical protein